MWPTIAAFLFEITGSLVKRALIAIGLGYVSYSGFTTLTDEIIGYAISHYQSLPFVVLQILNLGGVGDAFGIIASAMVVRSSLLAVKRLRPV